MKQEVLRVRLPAPVREPRGAVFAAQATAGLQRIAAAVKAAAMALWRALEDEGRRRAARELRRRGLSTPALEAAKVRELAAQYERTDPRFAAELRAAASRHEVMHGIQ